MGIVPKKAPGKFRLIHHLSHPEGKSVNDFIGSLLSSVSYASFQPGHCTLVQLNDPIQTSANMDSTFQWFLAYLHSLQSSTLLIVQVYKTILSVATYMAILVLRILITFSMET